jgi:hypothetical protein
MHVHWIAEMAYDPLGAQPAGFLFIRIAPFTQQYLLVVDGHAAAADPVLTVPRVNMVVIGQRGSPRVGYLARISSVASPMLN